MYESEANPGFTRGGEFPAEMLARFSESRKTIVRRTLIPWGEHCTECVWPTCYTSCDLYQPRIDGRCRRFIEGMVRIDAPDSVNTYVLKVSFKRWAKLWSPANLQLYSLRSADAAEASDLLAAACIRVLPGRPLKRFASLKRYSMKKRRMMRSGPGSFTPGHFLVECYNPNSSDAPMTVTMRRKNAPLPYQALLVMRPGFNRHQLGFAEIERNLGPAGPDQIELAPNDNPEGLTLYFGAMDFVVEKAAQGAPAPGPKTALCKCVVWDLDNTLWEGTLIEDGVEHLRLRPDIQDVLRSLDKRGILLSIASKNSPDDAMEALRRFGLDDYFLFPQISWEPKSQAVRQIAAKLNIGIDSLLFIDDQSFEREEVQSGCPGVMALDAADYQSLLDRPECQAPVTEESGKRRSLYRDQQCREEAQREFQGEYFSFLRSCNLRLKARPISEPNLDRVHELTQRTNQMNFSGNRYSRAQLQELMRNADIDAFVLDCADRFGSYGTIGLCLVNRATMQMTDLMFSCRVQGKRVEHAFLSYLLRRYRRSMSRDLTVIYRKTAKNAAPAKVFTDLGFQVLAEADGVIELGLPAAADFRDEGIVAIEDEIVPALSRLS